MGYWSIIMQSSSWNLIKISWLDLLTLETQDILSKISMNVKWGSFSFFFLIPTCFIRWCVKGSVGRDWALDKELDVLWSGSFTCMFPAKKIEFQVFMVKKAIYWTWVYVNQVFNFRFYSLSDLLKWMLRLHVVFMPHNIIYFLCVKLTVRVWRMMHVLKGSWWRSSF